MITLFTTPKPFTGIIKLIQENAIRSWRKLSVDIEIIIYTKEKDNQQLFEETCALVIDDIRTNDLGTPFISDLFSRTERETNNNILCYINADIILPKEFLVAAQQASSQFKKFLMVGCRNDLDWNETIDFSSKEKQQKFWMIAQERSQVHPVSGIDYFVYSRSSINHIPDLLAGRAGFDQWLIWKARRSLIPVIDASSRIFAIHQNHDYAHHPDGRDGVFKGEEAAHNRQYLGKGYYKGLNILDATYKFDGNFIVKKQGKEEHNRFINRLPKVFPSLYLALKLYKQLLLSFRKYLI
jgi:hypothetical protein